MTNLPQEFKKLEEAKEEKEDLNLVKENHGDEIKDLVAETNYIRETNMIDKQDAGAITE